MDFLQDVYHFYVYLLFLCFICDVLGGLIAFMFVKHYYVSIQQILTYFI